MRGNEMAEAVGEGEERVRTADKIFSVRRDDSELVNAAIAEPRRQKNIKASNGPGVLASAHVAPSADTKAVDENPVDQHIHRRRILVCAHPAGKAQSAEPAHRARSVRWIG